jgi:tetratricopeptide (TPR) repeat protein
MRNLSFLIFAVLVVSPISYGVGEESHRQDLNRGEIGSSRGDLTQARRGKHKRRKKRRKEGKMERQRMQDKVRSFLESLPEGESEQAQKVVQYLHTSHEVAKMYMREKNWEKAIQVLNKRSRLKVPLSFSSAPPFLKAVKLHSRMEIGRIYMKQKKYKEAVNILEEAFEMSKKEEIPSMFQVKIRTDLLKAYRKAGMKDKAGSMLEQTLQEAEQGLEFE